MDAPISVKRLLEQVKARVEPPFAHVAVVGEVSNLRTSGRHWYFTIKEDGAALQCAVWASQQRLLGHVPKDGQRVLLTGGLNLYVPGGSLTFAVTQCALAGVGDLQARLRQLEAELRAEGLFDRAKRELPRFPRRLGVVAALGGAALRDVLEVSSRRAPGVDVLVFPAAAQGERCVPENLFALQEIQDAHWGCDAVLLVRGGGSLEDLWGFNDPELVRAVATCRIPLVTGVGHEIDTTLVDLAADRRAATPSQAAELATPDRGRLMAEVTRRFEALHARLLWRLRGLESTLNLLADSEGMRSVPRRLERCGMRLDQASQWLQRVHPLATPAARLEVLSHRLERAHPQRRLDRVGGRLALLTQRLLHTAAMACGERDRARLVEAQRRLHPALAHLVLCRQRRCDVLAARLEGLDPARPLSQGFALVQDAEGRPVTTSQALLPGAEAHLRWHDGERKARML